MNGLVIRSLVVLIGALLALAPALAERARLTLVVGTGRAICHQAFEILAASPKEHFLNYDWTKGFGDISWEHMSPVVTTASGQAEPFDFAYAEFDIDNDGVSEVVVARSWSINSVLVDRWY